MLDSIFDQSIISTRTLSAQTEGFWQVAYPIQIRWKTSDWESKTTSGLSTTSSGTSGSASSTSSKLSTGSTVGIITGSISASATYLGLAFKVYKWKQSKKKPIEEVGLIGMTSAKSERRGICRLCDNYGASITTRFCTQCGA